MIFLPSSAQSQLQLGWVSFVLTFTCIWAAQHCIWAAQHCIWAAQHCIWAAQHCIWAAQDCKCAAQHCIWAAQLCLPWESNTNSLLACYTCLTQPQLELSLAQLSPSLSSDIFRGLWKTNPNWPQNVLTWPPWILSQPNFNPKTKLVWQHNATQEADFLYETLFWPIKYLLKTTSNFQIIIIIIIIYFQFSITKYCRLSYNNITSHLVAS
jgi:hypothetical protein